MYQRYTYSHAKGLHPEGHFFSYSSKTNDGQCFAHHLIAHELLPLPFAFPHGGCAIGYLSGGNNHSLRLDLVAIIFKTDFYTKTTIQVQYVIQL